MGFIKILTVVSALIITHSALADPKQEPKSHSIIAMWSSWIKDLKPKTESSAGQNYQKSARAFILKPKQANLSYARAIKWFSPLAL